MGEGFTTCRYTVDAADRIISVGGSWGAFAQANDAPELTAKRVLGQVIWLYIAGPDARIFYQDLFRRLRMLQREILVPFRCDSPSVARDMSLLMSSQVDGSIHFEGRLNACTEREFVPALSRHAKRTSDTLEICALCRRIHVGASWLGAASRRARELLFDPSRSPGLEETVCHDCRARALAAETPGPEGLLDSCGRS